ncbi:MAG: hypothetical protein ABIO46_05730 [Chitinophagales bacterium]
MNDHRQFFMEDKRINIALLVFLMLMVIAWCFGPMVLQPNLYYFSGGGDGIRNYYSLAYYVRFDGGLHFTGMNYPYGEHVMYADLQLPVAFLLGLIQVHLFDVSLYSVAIINYIMFISLILSAVFIYLLLYELKVKWWFAIPAAIAITIVSPQLQRMTGHYSLAYVFFTPMLLYILFRMQQSASMIKWMFLLSGMVFLFGLTHLYYLAMAGAFILAYVTVLVVFEFISFRKISNRFLWMLAGFILPFIAIQGFMFFTDPITDRIKIPWGFFHSYASGASVFLPPSWSYLRNFGLGGILSRTSRGYAYIGIVADLGIIFSVVLSVMYNLRKTTYQKNIPVIPVFLLIAVIASIPVLLFSMCLPWRWNMQELLNHFAFIRQFRALDRFAYVFYYVVSIFSAFILFWFIEALFKRRAIVTGSLVVLIVFVFWFADGWTNLKTLKDAYPASNYAREYFSKDNYVNWLAEKGYAVNDFQAIFPLPFYHLGSEKIWIDHPVSMYASSWASLNTGLPIVSSYLGRTSVGQTCRLVQLVSDSLMEKALIPELKSDKPFLVVTTNEERTAYENLLLSRATFINERGAYSMYLLPITAFKSSLESVRKLFAEKEKFLVKQQGNIFTNNMDSTVIINNFQASDDSFPGNGILRDSNLVMLFDGVINGAQDSSVFEVSVWLKLFMINYASPDLKLVQFNGAGEIISQKYAQAKSTPDISNGWARVNVSFELFTKSNRITILLNCEESGIAASRFMIRPLATDVYYPFGNDGSFILNNFLIRAP